MGIEKEDGLRAWRKNFERQHIYGAMGTEVGEGSYKKQSEGIRG
jgi:hypothetical protein